jgi:3-phosphoshikimate 1-carboxyvinyltransferase
VEYVENGGLSAAAHPRKKMRGGFDVTISAETSSQFVSALMLGGATLPDGITLRISNIASGPYIDITADILPTFGAHVERDGNHRPRARRTARAQRVSRRRRLLVGVVLVRRRRGDGGQRAGARTGGADRAGRLGIRRHPRGDGLRSRSDSRRCGPRAAELRGGTFDCNATPDIVPTLAAIAPLASTPCEIVNVANLRVKESDRLATVTSELRRLGATVEERPDSLLIQPGWNDAARGRSRRTTTTASPWPSPSPASRAAT